MNLAGKKLGGITALVLATAISQQAYANEQNNVVLKWNEALLQAVRDTNPGPPVVSRILAITHTCMYDAWAAYDAKAIGTRLGAQLRQPKAAHTEANKEEAISYAAYTAAVDLFPSEKGDFDSLMVSMGYDPSATGAPSNAPSSLGAAACIAVLDYRHHDGANQLGDLNPGAYSDYTGYQPVNSADEITDPNRWQPLKVVDARGNESVQRFLVPHWGKVTPFSFTDPSQFELKEPAKFGTKNYLEQVKEVISYSASLTDAQKVIAEYWADGPHSETPPGHWNLMAQFVSDRDGHDLNQDVKMFFALNNAIFDAGVFAWWAKRQYDYVRPVTAVSYLFQGQDIYAWLGEFQGAGVLPAEDWRPYQVASAITPPFSEYVSGHSTFSASAAEVLRHFTDSNVFGYSTAFEPGSSLVEPGMVPEANLTLSWATFSDAADEAGLSRLYGGIHFRDGDQEGRRVGAEIGKLAWKKSQQLFGQ